MSIRQVLEHIDEQIARGKLPGDASKHTKGRGLLSWLNQGPLYPITSPSLWERICGIFDKSFAEKKYCVLLRTQELVLTEPQFRRFREMCAEYGIFAAKVEYLHKGNFLQKEH